MHGIVSLPLAPIWEATLEWTVSLFAGHMSHNKQRVGTHAMPPKLGDSSLHILCEVKRERVCYIRDRPPPPAPPANALAAAMAAKCMGNDKAARLKSHVAPASAPLIISSTISAAGLMS